MAKTVGFGWYSSPVKFNILEILIRQHYLLMMHDAGPLVAPRGLLAARIARDTKMRPTRRRAQFDMTISPIIDPESAVKQIYCATLCDPVRVWCLT